MNMEGSRGNKNEWDSRIGTRKPPKYPLNIYTFTGHHSRHIICDIVKHYILVTHSVGLLYAQSNQNSFSNSQAHVSVMVPLAQRKSCKSIFQQSGYYTPLTLVVHNALVRRRKS